MPTAASDRPHGDRGETLIEILVALAILGIAVTALLGALGTHATVTGVNRGQAQASATLLAASEHVKSLPAAAVPCGSSSQTLTTTAVPHDPVFTVTYGPPVDFNAGTPCARLRRVPVRVTGDGFDLTVDVVKRP